MCLVECLVTFVASLHGMPLRQPELSPGMVTYPCLEQSPQVEKLCSLDQKFTPQLQADSARAQVQKWAYVPYIYIFKRYNSS